MKDKTIVGHSLPNDFKILNIDIEESKCVIRDISSIELFMKKIDKDSKSPLKLSEADLGSPKKKKNSPGKREVQEQRANCLILKRKLKELAEEFLNASI